MLLVRVRPLKNESLQSYCMKLAQSNGYHFSAFCTQIGKESKRYKSTKIDDRKEIVQLITDISGYEEVGDVVDFQACYKTHKSFVDYARIKICPKCIKNHDLPLYWSLKTYIVCVDHQIPMIDKCSSCNSNITEESLIKSCCIECLTPLNEMSSDKVKIDHYSEMCHTAFSTFQGDTLAFTNTIENTLRLGLEELIILKHVYGELCGQYRAQEKKRRLFSLGELREKQLACGVIAQDINNVRGALVKYAELKILAGHINLGSAFIEVIQMFKYQGAKRVKEVFESILFSPPKEIDNIGVGINWLEKYFDIPPDNLVDVVKNSCSNFILKTQGRESILLKDVKLVVETYDASTTKH
jgi:hypothetical protein